MSKKDGLDELAGRASSMSSREASYDLAEALPDGAHLDEEAIKEFIEEEEVIKRREELGVELEDDGISEPAMIEDTVYRHLNRYRRRNADEPVQFPEPEAKPEVPMTARERRRKALLAKWLDDPDEIYMTKRERREMRAAKKKRHYGTDSIISQVKGDPPAYDAMVTPERYERLAVKRYRKIYSGAGGSYVSGLRHGSEQDIPRYKGREAKYPFRKMKVGSMFSAWLDTTLIPVSKRRLESLAMSVRVAAKRYADEQVARGRPRPRYTVRTFDRCVRCWRRE